MDLDIHKQIQKLKSNAKIPLRGSSHAAGYDLCRCDELCRLNFLGAVLPDALMTSSCEDKIIPARGKALISTGLCIAAPEGTYGRVAPRSGEQYVICQYRKIIVNIAFGRPGLQIHD